MLPLVFSRKSHAKQVIILAGDVGATKTNLALIKMGCGGFQVCKEKSYSSQEYNSIVEITGEFLKDQPSPETCCIGVAGPVFNGKVNPTNLSWELDSHEIAREMGLVKVHLINDLQATAFGLAILTDQDTLIVHQGDDKPSGNAAVIAPGTGLGEAGLYFDGKFFHPFASEGGHTDFASRNKIDFELYEYLKNKFGHVSNERVLSGPGIYNIYRFLKDVKNIPQPDWITHKIEAGDAAAVISQHIDQSEICNETMRIFIRFLAHESANLTLKMKATGGLFIGGGIAPQIIPLFERYQFESMFIQSGRMVSLLEKVTVRIILDDKAALWGAAYYAGTM